ncbi:Nucleotide-binding universal stress protein, UspA family [Ekhidna lutea]|uniref:Nucleotide-binding universal stress protein, UspA family n=1 Tax=Ekhidna lutea TaxID=447679 RepID=A0A239HVY5_EKHLU|nr:universal stress protein [Ekhidna lutea]SNS85485.1 Nucleotide-binding universal stress protein, UspA family [Ekhidna lutea]
MKKILVPYDFSKVSEHALDFACQIADKADSDIMLLNVIEHPTADSFKTLGMQNIDPMEQLYIKKMYETTQNKLADVVFKAKYADDRIATKIQLGNPFKTIIDQITEEKVSLLVVGTEGSEGLNEFFVGSNAEKIVRKATCPVITVQDKCEIEPIEKIVFASDFQHTDDEFIGQLLDLQRKFEAQLNIVKINTPASFTSTRHDTKQMEDFVKKYSIENYTIDIYNYKNEEDGIILYAEDIKADMIALGTHQRKGVGHFLAGSIAEDVVNHSQFPVWTAHLKDD